MMSDQKEFPTAAVIGTITGVLLGPIGDIYKVSHFMTGEPIWTHQLPRVGREIRPVILRQHPQLTPVVAEAKDVTRDNWQQKLAGWVERFGETIAISPMSPEEHESIDPMSELAEMVSPEKIIVVGK